MKDFNEILEQLIQKIEEAFCGIAPPAKNNIVTCMCEECQTIQADFVRKQKDSWKGIDENTIEEHFDCLSLLSPGAFHYFLPAYLIYTLKHFEPGNDVCDFTLYTLCPGKDWKEKAEWWKNRFKYFSSEQINLIFAVMDLVLKDDRFDLAHTIIERGKQRLMKLLWD